MWPPRPGGHNGSGADQGAYVLAAQGCGDTARHQAVDHLDLADTGGIGHNLKEGPVYGQRSTGFQQAGRCRLGQEPGLAGLRPVRVIAVDAIHILDDGQAGRPQGIGQQEGAGIRPVGRDARTRKFVMW